MLVADTLSRACLPPSVGAATSNEFVEEIAAPDEMMSAGRVSTNDLYDHQGSSDGWTLIIVIATDCTWMARFACCSTK
jgi:hypothetical protein